MTARGEVIRIVSSLTIVCALGASVLGGLFVVTDRHQREAERRRETSAIAELLGLDSSATVVEVRQFLEPKRRTVIYEAKPLGEERAAPRSFSFTVDGAPVVAQNVSATAAQAAAPEPRVPLSRMFVARTDGLSAGFVVEGSTRGYKNRIRFLIGITQAFEIAGVRVVEHEEDPGLGAEIATRLFLGQYAGRRAAELLSLDVTRDQMPEDWRAALSALARTPVAATGGSPAGTPGQAWRQRNAALLERERTRAIYAVTGATISSRALTDGVRSTVDHFRRRWLLIEPYLSGAS